ncbi:MAG TPA: hypothetical protein VEA99_01625 [Gemmatimonadaceae bacterium]|nr:hypothetical protein [Gemmatimonadaceae bacterium]
MRAHLTAVGRRVASCVAVILLAACSRPIADVATGPDASAHAARADFRIVMERDGGLGSLWIRESVDGATGQWLATTHRICSVPQCQAAMDSATGTFDAATIASLMETVDFARLWTLADDYGRTPNSADMMDHTLKVRYDGRDKTVHGDDGTFPEPARRVSTALHEAIWKARGR